MTVTRYGIGTLANNPWGIQSLEDAGITQEPRVEWIEGEIIELADGSTRILGYPIARWSWSHIRQASRDALRAFCTGASQEVYIQTIDNEETFGLYHAIMRWPKEERTREGYPRSTKWNFTVDFLILHIEGQSPSMSPSASYSPSASVSPSVSASLSPSASVSPSVSASLSPSASVSRSVSPSVSSSVSPSVSRSVSPSVSRSVSPSVSPS